MCLPLTIRLSATMPTPPPRNPLCPTDLRRASTLNSKKLLINWAFLLRSAWHFQAILPSMPSWTLSASKRPLRRNSARRVLSSVPSARPSRSTATWYVSILERWYLIATTSTLPSTQQYSAMVRSSTSPKAFAVRWNSVRISASMQGTRDSLSAH